MKVNIIPDSLQKIFAKHLSGILLNCLPQYIKTLMNLVKIAIQESVAETIKFRTDYGKVVLSVNSLDANYAFSEGIELITGDFFWGRNKNYSPCHESVAGQI